MNPFQFFLLSDGMYRLAKLCGNLEKQCYLLHFTDVWGNIHQNIFFFKSVIGSNKESKKILKDLYSALKSESSSEPEFTRKPFIDHNSGRDVFPGQVEVSNEWTNQMLYKCLIITVLQENLWLRIRIKKKKKLHWLGNIVWFLHTAGMGHLEYHYIPMGSVLF